jgi:hypothetical protein
MMTDMRGGRGLNRRSFFQRVTGAALGAGAAAFAVTREAQAVDSDPTDRCRDTDPTDPSLCQTRSPSTTRPIGFVLLVAGVGAAAAGTYLRRKNKR